jgi:uncharacterized membrane protein YphA (DoxX/SURF4 family)
MEPTPLPKKIALEIICLLYIVLFVYAAVSKLLDFENFQVQLGQSPLLSAFAGWIAFIVPISELIIAALLVFPRYRLLAMYMAFSLMIMFTAYIIIILNFSPFVPCSCGGILEKLGWKEHLIFNIAFCLSGIAALLMLRRLEMHKARTFVRRAVSNFGIASSVIISSVLVTVLFLVSEHRMTEDNPFIRRFQGYAVKTAQTQLPNNDYYFAGQSGGRIYLANSKAPLYITEIDTSLQQRIRHKIALPDYDLPFTNVRVQVAPPYFYLYDGTVPVFFKGHISNWKAHTVTAQTPYFSQSVVMDSANVAFRSENEKTEFVLGNFSMIGANNTEFKEGLLTRQVDGFFDCDGQLHWDSETKRLLYLYSYRNQYLIMDEALTLINTGNTIDTTSKARIKVAYLEDQKKYKMSAPPYTVNKNSAFSNGLLYVRSGVIGRFEDKVMWDQASIVDIYDTRSQRYRTSIYIYDAGKLKMTHMTVYGRYLYVLLGYNLHRYTLSKI